MLTKATTAPTGDELDRIGRLGEQRFENLCTSARLECSRLVPDRTGVDFIVTFPSEPFSAKASYDTRNAPKQIVVQVKTVVGSDRPAVLALSVAERLVKRSEPAIICWMRHDEATDSIVEIRFVHLLNDGMARVLKGLRKAYKAKKKDLRKVDLTFPSNSGFTVDMNVFSFRQSLEQLCEPSMEAYAEKKSYQFRNLGFDEQRITGSVRFLESDDDDLADLFLGLRSIPIKGIDVFEGRFGIKLPLDPELCEMEEGVISVDPTPSRNVQLRITTQLGDEWLVEADLFGVPMGIFGQTPYGLVKWPTGHIRLDWGKASAKLTVNLNCDGRRTGQAWLCCFGAVQALLTDTCTLEVVLDGAVCRLGTVDWRSERRIEGIEPLVEASRKYRDILDAMQLGSIEFSDEDLRGDHRTLSRVHAMFTRNMMLEVRTEPWKMSQLSNVRTCFITAFQVFGHWIGMAVPTITETEHSPEGIVWRSYKTDEPIFYRIEPEVESSFDVFMDIVDKLMRPKASFIQRPGGFLELSEIILRTELIDELN